MDLVLNEILIMYVTLCWYTEIFWEVKDTNCAQVNKKPGHATTQLK